MYVLMRAGGVNIRLTAHKRGACLYAYGFREGLSRPARTRSDEKERGSMRRHAVEKKEQVSKNSDPLLG